MLILICDHCGRTFTPDEGLLPGDACPSDDCPSHEKPASMPRPTRITREFTQNTPPNTDPLALYTVLRRPTLLALQIAIEKCGSEASLARRLGVTQQALNKWKHYGRDIPMARWETLLQLAEHGELI